MNKLWGVPLIMQRWLAIHRCSQTSPNVQSTGLVWAKACDCEWAKAELNRLNRLALVSMGHFRHSTPMAGLEVIAHVMPLDLHVRCEVALELKRTQGQTLIKDGRILTKRKTLIGRRQYCQQMLTEAGVPDTTSDLTLLQEIWERLFQVDKNNFSKGT